MHSTSRTATFRTAVFRTAVFRTATLAAASTLLTFCLMPAAQAGTGAGIQALPSDCSTTSIDPKTMSLTCTNRPPTQRWRLLVYCMGWGVQDEAYGNIVTGNGTSTAHCSAGTAAFPNFVVVP